MFTARQVPQSDMLVQLRRADRVYVRLALSYSEQSGWIARGLVVDILPKRWLDNPDISENVTGPWWKPSYLFVADRAIFLRGFLGADQVHDWFRSPANRELRNFDARPGYGSHCVPFALPDFQDTVTEEAQPSYGGWIEPLRYPTINYTLQTKAPYVPSNYDPAALIGWDNVVGEGKYYPDFRTAQAAMILGLIDPRRVSNVNDMFMMRVVRAAGWIEEVHVLPDKVVVTVGGTEIIGSGFVVLDGLPEVSAQERVINRHVTLPLPERLPPYTRVVLIRGSEEVDVASFGSASSPYPQNSPQVVVEREDVAGYRGAPTEAEAEPSPGDTLVEDVGDTFDTGDAGAFPLAQPYLYPQTPPAVSTPVAAEPAGASALPVDIVPFEVIAGTRGYIEKVVYQINRTYQADCYDACAVMIRRLIESLIIEVFEQNAINDNIKGANGEYLALSGLVGKVLSEKSWHLTRNTTQALAKLKQVGDIAAHNPRVNLVRDDIDGIAFGIRVAVEELLLVAKLK